MGKALCPLLSALVRRKIECLGLRCMWYDDENNCCVIITFARGIKLLKIEC